MNVTWVCIIRSRPHRAGGVYISGVDFGCFSIKYRDCEALVEREEQTDFTLLLYICARTILRLYNKIMKHKIFTFLLAVMASVGMSFAETYSGSCGENLTWSLNTANSILTISGTGAMETYNLRSEVPWFSYCTEIKSIVIGSNVTSISGHAFDGCNKLTSVTIPNSITSIGYNAFYGCSSLTSITIPNSVTSIEDNVFACCSSLTSIVVKSGNTEYDSRDNCNAIIETGTNTLISGCKNTIIPNSITSIGYNAFYGCSDLTSITIPDSVTSIRAGAFSYCSNLTSAAVGNSVTSIENDAFRACNKMTSVKIGNNVKYIGSSAFYGCNKLISITIPNSVKSIGENAFIYCRSLTSITCEAIYPPTLDSEVFSEVNKSIPLYVPRESISAYKNTNQWGDFTNILPIEETEGINYTTLADIYNMAADSAFTLGAFDVVYVPSFQNGSNMYIKDSTGACVIYKVNYGLQAGDHVEAGLQGKISIYNGLYEIIPITAKEELIITHGAAPAPMVATEVPSLDNASQYVVYEGVSFATDTAFVEGKRHAVYGSWNGQTITFYNQYYIGATLSAGRTYNITAVNTIYRTTPQAYPLAVEEVTSEPCLLASGTCGAQGDNLTWTLSCDSVLTISGTGAMADYQSNSSSPWYAYRKSVKTLIFESGITSIDHCFNGFSNLMSIYNYATTPHFFDIDDDSTFGGVPLTCTLYVPAESIEAYKTAEVWKDFGTILPIEGTVDENILSIAEAVQIGMALDSMATSAETYTIEGYVINAGAFSSQFKNQNWYMADDPNATSSDFYAYRCYPIDGTDTVEVHNGAKVRMTGKLQKYYDRTKSVYVVEMKTTPATILVKSQIDTITVAQALEIGVTLAENASTAKQYVIRGYVTSITTPFDEQYGNQTFYIADDINSTADSYATGGFQVYRGKPVTGKAIAVGALVELTTAIKNYRGIIIESAETNVPVTVLEEGPECRILSGACGENLTWTLNTCDSVLAISGTGAMYDYSKQNVAPWAYLGVKSVVIGNGVTTLGTFAFYQCAMSSISIPASVTKVHFNTFNNSYNLMNFTVDSANPVYSSLDGVLFNKDQTIIVRYPRGRQGEYAIPEGVVIVGDGAFNGCYNVTDVKIPNSVTTLGMAAFFACGMAEITIPENVNRIDSLAFIGCQHLKVVTNYAIEPQVIDTNVFGGVIDISECTLYVPAQSLAAYQTADVWKDFGTILPIEGTEEPVETVEGNYTIYYEDKDSQNLTSEVVTLHVPVAPVIEGFTFVEWRVVEGSLSLGITIQAVYKANEPTSAPEIYTNPANSAQKLIRNGNVYILTDDKVYTITGQKIQSY